MKTAKIFSFENKQKLEGHAVKYCITFYQNITTQKEGIYIKKIFCYILKHKESVFQYSIVFDHFVIFVYVSVSESSLLP